MVTVTSIDVGTKNTAICQVCTEGPGGQQLRILHWDLVDFVGGRRGTCGEVKQNGSVCGRLASYSGETLQGANRLYCGVHKDRHVENVEPDTSLAAGVPDGLLCEWDMMQCIKRASRQLLSGAYCRTHALAVRNRATKRVALKALKLEKADTNQIRLAVWRKLDALPVLLAADRVVLETQPAGQAFRTGEKQFTFTSKATLVSEMLATYFTGRGIIDKERTGSTIQSVVYRHSKTKLTAATSILGRPPFSGNKAAAKQLCQEASRHVLDQEAFQWLNSHSKKDDLCDALMQAIAEVAKLRAVEWTCLRVTRGAEEGRAVTAIVDEIVRVDTTDSDVIVID